MSNEDDHRQQMSVGCYEGQAPFLSHDILVAVANCCTSGAPHGFTFDRLGAGRIVFFFLLYGLMICFCILFVLLSCFGISGLLALALILIFEFQIGYHI